MIEDDWSMVELTLQNGDDDTPQKVQGFLAGMELKPIPQCEFGARNHYKPGLQFAPQHSFRFDLLILACPSYFSQDFGMFFFGVANAGARSSASSGSLTLTEFTGISKLKHGQTLKIQIRYWNILKYKIMYKTRNSQLNSCFQVKVDGMGTLTGATTIALIVQCSECSGMLRCSMSNSFYNLFSLEHERRQKTKLIQVVDSFNMF